VIDRLKGQRWPGNIRELQAVVENAAYHAHYRGRAFVSREDMSPTGTASLNERSPSFHERTERFKLDLVEDALAQCEGSQVRAARMLGLDRGTLRRIVARSSAPQ